jgi:sugar phosphate isomerase/epimerase
MAIAYSTAIESRSSLEDAASNIQRHGGRVIDLLAIEGWVHVDPSDLASQWETTVARLDAALAAHALVPIALNTGVAAQLHHRSPAINAARHAHWEGLVRLMKHVGVEVAAIQPRNADRERPYDDVWRDCVATLREQLAVAQAAGVRFALELHIGSPFETMEQARRLLDALPDLPLVYDPTHFVMQGIDVRDTAWLMDRAVHVHLRDAAPSQMQVPFGTGAVDFDWVLGTLRERGYGGHFSIEYLGTAEFDVWDSVRRLHEAIAQHFDR